MSWPEILAVIAIVGFVICRQIAGQKLPGKRMRGPIGGAILNP